MNVNVRIEKSGEIHLIGKSATLSLLDYKVSDLWRSFLPRRKEILNTVSSDLYSVSIYPPDYFKAFNPATKFEKFAGVEVPDFIQVPPDMETLVLTGGLYAVFEYKGLSTDNSIYRFIYEQWMPDSEYALDGLPHFEILGKKYKNNDPDSEEEIWIPVKSRHG